MLSKTRKQPEVEKFLSEHSLVVIGYRDNAKGVNLFHLLGLSLEEDFEKKYPAAFKHLQVTAIKKTDNDSINIRSILKYFQSCYHVGVSLKDGQEMDRSIIYLDFYTESKEIIRVSGECNLRILSIEDKVITYCAEFVFFCNKKQGIEYDYRRSLRSSSKFIKAISEFLLLPVEENDYDFYRGDAESILSWRIDDICILEGLKSFYQSHPNELSTSCVSNERVDNLVSPLYWKVRNKFFNESQITKMAIIAANYWAGLVGNPGFNDDLIADMLHVNLLKKSEPGDVELFKQNLIREIQVEFNSWYNCQISLPEIILKTDYGAEGLLAKASAGTGVSLPWKTISWLSLVSFTTRRECIFKEDNLFDD